MSQFPEVKKCFDAEVKKRGADPAKGLEIGAWTVILRSALEKWGGTDGQIAEAFLQADTNKDNVLTFEEFVTCMTKPHLDKKKESEVDALFKTWDKSGDSKLTKEEVQQAAGKYREETIAKILQDADTDGDGYITVAEFKAKLFGCE